MRAKIKKESKLHTTNLLQLLSGPMMCLHQRLVVDASDEHQLPVQQFPFVEPKINSNKRVNEKYKDPTF